MGVKFLDYMKTVCVIRRSIILKHPNSTSDCTVSVLKDLHFINSRMFIRFE